MCSLTAGGRTRDLRFTVGVEELLAREARAGDPLFRSSCLSLVHLHTRFISSQ